MQGPNSTLLLVGIKHEEVNTENGELVLWPYKEEVSRTETVLEHRESQGGSWRLCAEKNSIESSESDCVSSGDEWKPSPASSPSPAEVNHGTATPTIPSSVPTGDLNAATCLSDLTKTSNPTACLEKNTSGGVLPIPILTGMLYSKVEEHTGKEPTNPLEDDRNLPVREYICEFCGKAFAQKWNMDQHVNGVHKNLRSFPCDICGFSFKYNGHLKSHVDSVHKTLREFICAFCGKTFAQKSNLDQHVNGVHKNLRSFLCDICAFSFKYRGDLKSHVDSVHKSTALFISFFELSPRLFCFCECLLARRLDIDFNALSGNARLIDKFGQWTDAYNCHLPSLGTTIVEGNEDLRNFPCNICGHSFTRKAAVKEHVNTVHKNMRNFPCDMCGVSFKYSGNLKSHVNAVHENMRNFPCDICGFSFKYSGGLKSHVDCVHKNLRNFPCDICGNLFKRRGNLNKHINTVHKS